MANYIKWDISRLTSLVRTLNNEKESIESNRDFLMNINSEVEKAWQGYAGRAFDERMDVDAENLQVVINGIEALVNDLNRVISDCYEDCEENIKNEIDRLRSKV